MVANTAIPILFSVWIAMACLWLAFMIWFLRRLRKRYPDLYAKIGSPTLFWNNSMRSQWLLFRLCWSPPEAVQHDRVTVRAMRFMNAFVICYTLGFACLFLTFIALAFIK